MNAASKHDWGMVLAGLALVILGVVFLMAPGLSLVTIAALAGGMLIAVGVVDAILYFRHRKERGLTGWALAYAALDILLGIALFAHPLISASVIPWIVGIFLTVYGVLEIVAAWRMRKGASSMRIGTVRELGVGVASDPSEGWGWVLFGGVLAILVALTFFFIPAAFILFLSFYLVARGVMLAVYGLIVGRISPVTRVS